jgi:hypothetical protein
MSGALRVAPGDDFKESVSATENNLFSNFM